MKQVIILIAILFSFKGYSQNSQDAIIGKWLKIPKEDLIIEVYKKGNEYKGKITWSKNNDKKKPAFLFLKAYSTIRIECGRVEKFNTLIQEVRMMLKRR